MRTLDIDILNKKEALKYIKKREEKIESIDIMPATELGEPASIVKVYFNNGKQPRQLYIEVADTDALYKKLNKMDLPVQ